MYFLQLTSVIAIFFVLTGCEKKDEMTPVNRRIITQEMLGRDLTLNALSDDVSYEVNELLVVTHDFILNKGVNVIFSNEAGIIVKEKGRLELRGEQGAHVKFKGGVLEYGSWKGIQVKEEGTLIAENATFYSGGVVFAPEYRAYQVSVFDKGTLLLNDVVFDGGFSASLYIDSRECTSIEMNRCAVASMNIPARYLINMKGNRFFENSIIVRNDDVSFDGDDFWDFTGISDLSGLSVSFRPDREYQNIKLIKGNLTIIKAGYMHFAQESRFVVLADASLNIQGENNLYQTKLTCGVASPHGRGWYGIEISESSTGKKNKIEDCLFQNLEHGSYIELHDNPMLDVIGCSFEEPRKLTHPSCAIKGGGSGLVISNNSFNLSESC